MTSYERAAPVPYDCPYCKALPAGAEPVVALPAPDPAAPGHTIVVPRRHVANWLELGQGEKQAAWELADAVCAQLMEADVPDGFTIGIDAGIAAGQTVMHAGIQIIPRYAGDTPDPRGGVRKAL